MGGSITPTQPHDGEPSGLARRVGWALYWLLVLVAATLTILSFGGGAGRTSALAWPLVFLASCAPFLWLVLGTPPGYSALGASRTRLTTMGGSDDGPAPSSLRFGVELLSAVFVVLSVAGTLLFSGIEGSIGLVETGDGGPLAHLVANTLGLGPGGPTTLFALAVVGMLLAGLSWFSVWLVG